MNNRGSVEQKRKIEVRQGVVFDSSGSGWTYSHHASLVYFRGRYYAMWSNGRINEDDIGQRVLMAVSKDGLSWSAPRELFAPMEGNGVLTSAGWYLREDGVLNAYAGLYFYPDATRPKGDRDHVGTTLLCKTSRDGVAWSEAVDLHLPIIPNQGPHRLMSGRLIIDGNVTFPYTDDPKGLEGWKLAGISPCPMEGLQDDSEGFHRHAELRGASDHVCEGSHFQTEDSCIRMLLRNATPANVEDRFLCLSESTDNGVTYSAPRRIDFTDNNSKFYCIRLSNGRYAVIGNPDQHGRRCPLSVLISDDCIHFNRRYDLATEELPRKFDGMYKGGIYAYPHAVEVNGRLLVIFSVNKEDIRAYSVAVDDLI